MGRAFLVVDAFAATPYTGNPAAVVLDAHGLSSSQMQAIAAEFNLSETTFVFAAEPPTPTNHPVFEFRWFTPTVEVDVCGHATIAGIHALVESKLLPLDVDTGGATASIQTRSGLLDGFVEPIPGSPGLQMIWLDLPDPVLTPEHRLIADLPTVLGLTPDVFDGTVVTARTQDGDLLVFVRDVQAVNEAKPDFTALATLLNRHNLRGLSLATVRTLTPSIHVQSRFFAPSVGVNEDSVTGSVHGPLAAAVVGAGLIPLHDGLAAVSCVQGKAGGRSGMVHVLVQPQDGGVMAVRIGGRAVTTMRGEFATDL